VPDWEFDPPTMTWTLRDGDTVVASVSAEAARKNRRAKHAPSDRDTLALFGRGRDRAVMEHLWEAYGSLAALDAAELAATGGLCRPLRRLAVEKIAAALSGGHRG